MSNADDVKKTDLPSPLSRLQGPAPYAGAGGIHDREAVWAKSLNGILGPRSPPHLASESRPAESSLQTTSPSLLFCSQIHATAGGLSLSSDFLHFASQSDQALCRFGPGTTPYRDVFRAFAWFSRVWNALWKLQAPRKKSKQSPGSATLKEKGSSWLFSLESKQRGQCAVKSCPPIPKELLTAGNQKRRRAAPGEDGSTDILRTGVPKPPPAFPRSKKFSHAALRHPL